MLLRELQEGTRCWKGYKKKGMKTMFGKRVPNCVKNESDINESDEIPIIHNAMVGYVTDHFKGYENNYDTMEEIDFSINQLIDHATLRDLNLHNAEVHGQPIENYTSSPRDVLTHSKVADEVKQQLDISHIKEVDENLRAWFGKGKKGGAGGGGWDRYNTKGERIGKCGDAKKGEGKPKCLSKSKAASLRAKGGKSAIGKAVSKKRRNDPNKNRKGKAKNVSNTVGKK